MNEGSIWKLSFDKGTFRILHLVTGWTGIGSYTLAGNQLMLFNDPSPREVGRYTWQLDKDGLASTTIADHCAADLRSHNLEQMTWQSCAYSTFDCSPAPSE